MPPSMDRLRATVEALAAMERPSASPGELRSAEWIRDHLRELGLDARIEVERGHGTFWVPLGLLAGVAAAAGLLGRRRPGAAAVASALAAAAIADDVTARGRAFRRLLPQRETYNVVAEAGDPRAKRTLVLVAHHDAAHGGLIYAQAPVQWLADRFPGWYARQQTGARPMWLVAGGPALVALGAATGVAAVRRAGTVIALGTVAAMVDIACRRVVPGANDNLSSVAALVEVAHALREAPAAGVGVLLAFPGSEESGMEGMRGFVARHRAELAPATTEVIVLESVGSPELILMEGEGMLAIRDYPAGTRERIAAVAAAAGIRVRRGLRTGLATDALVALRAGYPCATIASVTAYKLAANYHTQRDVPEHLAWETVRDAAALAEALVRSPA